MANVPSVRSEPLSSHNHIEKKNEKASPAYTTSERESGDALVAKVLAHLDLPTTLPAPAPARAPPWSEDELDRADLDFDDDNEELISLLRPLI